MTNIIGTTEYIYLPDVSDDAIPTKVDTGADSSAIWASSIKEEDGVLHYVLFAPQSAFYTGKVIQTKVYSLVMVKNSFGEKEYRYRVTLSVKVANKRYKTSFTLADRSRNRFPVLLGKKFLKDRFLVDVARHNLINTHDNEQTKEVIVLTSRTDEATKEFFKTVAELSATKIELAKYRLLSYEINQENIPKITLEDGADIACVQKVYFKAHALYPEHAGTIAKYLKYRHVDFMDKEVANLTSRSKLSELFMLAIAGVTVPAMKTFTHNLAAQTYENLCTFFDADSFVVKDAFSDRGKDNFIVASKADFQEVAARLNGRRTVIAQQFIPNDGFLRVLLMGDEVVQVVHRASVAHPDSLKGHLNKPRGSINATVIPAEEVDSMVLTLARRAALTLERTVTGIDLVQDKETKKWYVLEANYNPEITSGVDIKQKAKGLAKLLRQRK
jgi:glutathione synthase/RimK-type ligase-like ATP-grasp enzyme